MYSVYVNVVHDKAIVHLSTCSWANNGAGVHPNASGRVDGWMTFNTRDRAFLGAQLTRRGTVRGCQKCNP